MDGRTLATVLRACSVTRPHFCGVYPADGIEAPRIFPASMIVNLDEGDEPGSHWVAMFSRDEGEVDYFDSYGQPPPEGGIKQYFDSFAKRKVNPFVIQSVVSPVCGHYCLYFIFMRSKGTTYDMLLNELAHHDNLDQYVLDFSRMLTQ